MHTAPTRAQLVVLALVGIQGCSADDLDDAEDLGALDDELEMRGAEMSNGLKLGNGLKFGNGLKLANGLDLSNGLKFANGLSVDNGLKLANGLDPQNGILTTEAGRTFAKYLVECALPSGDSITKVDSQGVETTYSGLIGLAPQWKSGPCDATCQEWVSACLMARTNAKGLTVRIDARGLHPALGTSPADPRFVAQEAAFYGNLWSSPPEAFACMGREAIFGVFGGRICSDGESCGFARVKERCKDLCADDHGSFKDCQGAAKKYKNAITVFLDPMEFAAGCPPGCHSCSDGVCHIGSAGDLSCAQTTVTCPDGMDCAVWCTGKDSCKDAVIQGPADHDLFVDCYGETACEKAVLTSNAGHHLACNGKGACKDTVSACGADACDVDVACTGEDACNKADFLYDGGASDVGVTCEGKEACKDAELECGSGTCDVTCGAGDHVCEHFEVE